MKKILVALGLACVSGSLIAAPTYADALNQSGKWIEQAGWYKPGNTQLQKDVQGLVEKLNIHPEYFKDSERIYVDPEAKMAWNVLFTDTAYSRDVLILIVRPKSETASLCALTVYDKTVNCAHSSDKKDEQKLPINVVERFANEHEKRDLIISGMAMKEAEAAKTRQKVRNQ